MASDGNAFVVGGILNIRGNRTQADTVYRDVSSRCEEDSRRQVKFVCGHFAAKL